MPLKSGRARTHLPHNRDARLKQSLPITQTLRAVLPHKLYHTLVRPSHLRPQTYLRKNAQSSRLYTDA
jgi:hypothetical protein